MAASGGRVIILKGKPGQDASYKLLQLPNPCTGQPQQYILGSAGLLEINRVKHSATCWLVNDTFVSDGSAFLATPVNLVFVLLATFRWQPQQTDKGPNAGSTMFQDAETLLCSQDWPAAQQLLSLAEQHLPSICDVTNVDEVPYYRLNRNKVLAYLRVCCSQALAAFRAASASSIAGLPESEQQIYVLRFMREYLSQAWHDQLVSSYGLNPAAISACEAAGVVAGKSPAAAVPAETAPEKKLKVEDPKATARKKAEESRAAAAQAKLKQQAVGTKKISQFFTAKKPAVKQ